MPSLSKLLLATALCLLLAACAGLPPAEELEAPRYQTGGHMGAEFCATCHPDTHEQWQTHSRHALATRSEGFRKALEEVLTNPGLNGILTDKMCYSCHGDPAHNEGINCEACHGAPLKDVDIMVTHEQKYTPRLKREMRGKSDFCGRCHEVNMPVTGDLLTSVHSEWRNSPAAKRGKSCQSCHMPKPEGEYAYHGFNTLVRNPDLYDKQLRLRGVKADAKTLRVTVENRVTGHAIPAAGPTRVLALKLTLLDAAGNTVHSETRRFFKHFAMAPLIGGVPFKLIENTQLQAGEKRRLRFHLPMAARRAAREARLTLRMYEVADKYEGDIDKAHWGSQPLASARLRLPELD